MKSHKPKSCAKQRDTEAASAAAERRLLAQWARRHGWDRHELATRLDLHAKDGVSERTVLGWAARAGDVDGATLVAAGSDLESRDIDDATPLIVAARSCSAPTVRALLAAGADPFAADFKGWTALMHASEVGDLPSVKALSIACDAKAAAFDGMTALMLAARRPCATGADIAIALLALSNASAKDSKGMQAIDHAAAALNFGVVELLSAKASSLSGLAGRNPATP